MNLFDGKVVSLDEFKKLFLENKSWVQDPVSHNGLFLALQIMRDSLIKKEGIYNKLEKDLLQRGDVSEEDVKLSMHALIDFIDISNLRLKLKREFKTEYPFEMKRLSMRENHFESYYPLGVLVHVTPNNSPLPRIFSVTSLPSRL